jgi:tetratricopeptide (TPR) repeat protein
VPAASQRLNEALTLHRSGRLNEAIAGYRALLVDEPRSADTLHLLGLALNQRGETAEAIATVERAIDLRPASALFHFNLGRLLAGAGRHRDAEAAYRQAVKLDPTLADAHNNLGLLAQRRGDAATAMTAFQAALNANADHGPARVNLARVLIEAGRAEDARPHLDALTAQAKPPAEAWFLAGTIAEDTGDFDAAIDAYRKALAIAPTFDKARNNLGTALLGARRYGEAREVFIAMFHAKRGAAGADPGRFEAGTYPSRPGTRLHTSRYRLTDSADQIDYLIAGGFIDPSWSEAAGRYRHAIAALDRAHPPDRPVVLEGAEADALAVLHDSALRVADTPELDGAAIGQTNDYAAIEDAYLAAATSVTTIDNFLSPRALAMLRDYCRQSTIFFGYNATGYVTSYMADGFACSLLYRIAEELQAAMPRVLGSRPLHNMWVYRHTNQGAGVEAHTDEASVTFNFYITEDDANLDFEHGGLIVYAREQPLDWDWTDMNLRKNDPDVRARIRDFLSDAPEVVLAHRENRAVLFHSNLFHTSDRFRFKDGFANRRMNVTLLFGERGS